MAAAVPAPGRLADGAPVLIDYPGGGGAVYTGMVIVSRKGGQECLVK